MLFSLIIFHTCCQVFLTTALTQNIENYTSNLHSTDQRNILDTDIQNECQKKQKLEAARDSHDLQTDSNSEWYNDVPLLPIVFATSPTLPDGPCKRTAQLYLQHLNNGTLWATQMYDASTKYPEGVFSGNTRYLGDFDSCYDLEVKLPVDSLSSNENLRANQIGGRYCLVDFKYEKRSFMHTEHQGRLELEFDPQDSVWEAIREKGDFRRVKRYMLQLALCVPDICTSTDVELALQTPLKTFGLKRKLNIDVSVKEHFCQAKKDAPKFSKSARIFCAIFAGLATLVIVSTCYESALISRKKEKLSFLEDLLLCFSARQNFNTLIEPTEGHRGLETLNMIRFFYFCLTMVGHRSVQYYAAPTANASYIEWFYNFKQSMLVFAGPVVVEGFLSMGGLLVSYHLLMELDKKKKVNFLGVTIMRFFRLTPPYMFIVFFIGFVLPHLGSGPYWEWKIGFERDNCLNNWWTNLLYVNNYIHPERACMFQSWYLAVDYHLFIIALIAVYIFWKMPRKIGYPFLISIILSGCIIPFVNTYFYNVQPLYKGLIYMQEVRYDTYFTEHYVKSHERISSYFVGVLVGAVIYDHSRKPWRLGKVPSNILFIICTFGLLIGSEFAGHKYFDPNTSLPSLEAALYACSYKIIFALGTCAMPALITFGDGLDFHYNFLTPTWVQPLARLSYGAYLIHTVHQLYDVATTRSSRTFRLYNMFWDIVPDVAYTFFLSLLLALMIEGPFRRLEKRFITKRAKDDSTKRSSEETKKAN